MIREQLLRLSTRKLAVNPIVKAYITSEALLWSGWNLVIPIIALFVIDIVPGGSIQIAAMGFSLYLMTRVVFELISGKYLAKTTDRKKLAAATFGTFLTSMSFLSFAYATTIPAFFVSFILSGLGFGIGTPAKNALFSIHIDKYQETTEWGVADGVTLICMALATTLGGFIATEFGFRVLFLIASGVSFLGIIPYFLNLFDTK